MIGSRPIAVTRSASRGCWRPASCASRSCPSVADEQFRDLVRAIEDVRGDLMRARHRLAKFLLRRGERYPGPGARGRARTCAWLRALALRGRLLAGGVRRLPGRGRAARGSPRDAARRARGSRSPTSSHARVIARLRCFRGHRHALGAPGCAPRSATSAALRQAHAAVGLSRDRPLRAHLRHQAPPGLDHQGRPGHARRLLVEAAQHYRHPPAHRRRRSPRRQARPGPARDRDRLARPAAPAPALAAPAPRSAASPPASSRSPCARELAAFCWEAATLD